MELSYKLIIRILLKIFFILIFLFSIYVILMYPKEGEYLLAYPIILSCIYGWIYVTKFRIEVSDNDLKAYGVFRKKVISFSEIVEIEIYTDQLIVRSANSKIKITSDLIMQKEAILFILDKIKNRKNELKVKGDKTLKSEFLA